MQESEILWCIKFGKKISERAKRVSFFFCAPYGQVWLRLNFGLAFKI
jgi:hypothetical protein